MPLLGKLSSNSVPQLLEAAMMHNADATLHIITPEHQGKLKIEQGQVTHIQEKQQAVHQTLEKVKNLQNGHFLLYQEGELLYEDDKDPTPPLWLLDSDQTRSMQIHQALNTLGFPVCVISDVEQLLLLLQELCPKLLIVDQKLTQFREAEFLSFFKNNPQSTKLMLVGSLTSPSTAYQEIGAEVLPWPIVQNELKERIETWIPLPQKTTSENDAHAVLEMLAKLTPRVLEKHVQVFSSKSHELEEHNFDPAWVNWLHSLNLKFPLEHFLQLCPGSKEYGRVLVHQLLQLGILATEDPNKEFSHIIEGIEEAPPPLQLHKVIVLGLYGVWQQDWITSLRKIALNQAARIPRESPFPVPQLPDFEHARIPLHKDTLLIVYGAEHEAHVRQIIESTNPHITGFLHFTDLQNEAEVRRVQLLRQQMETTFKSRHIYMVGNQRKFSDEKLKQILNASQDKSIITAEQFDLHSTHKALQNLLQSFSRK